MKSIWQNKVHKVTTLMHWWDSENALEIKGQVGGNDANIKQVLHGLKLPLLEVAEDVETLQKTTTVCQVVRPCRYY